MKDLPLTPNAMPALTVGGERYPLFFAVASIKEWAESKGIEFKQAVDDGWVPGELTPAEMHTLMLAGLKGGEARRMMFNPESGAAHTIDDAFVDQCLAALYPAEVWALLLLAWNGPGVEEDSANPPMGPEQTSTGEPLSD